MTEKIITSLERERVVNLYRIASYGLFGNLFFPFVSFFILKPHIHDLKITIWLIIIILYNSARIFLFRKIFFSIKDKPDEDFKHYHVIFYISVIFSAIIWSSLVFLPGKGNLSQYLIDLQIILGVVAIASIATLFLSVPATLTFLAITGFALISRVIQVNDPRFIYLGAGIFIFTIALVILELFIYSTQMRFLKLINENQKLLEQKNQQQDEISNLNQNLEKRLENERIISTGIQDALDFQSRVLENSLSGMFVLDTKGFFIQLNEIGANILGYSKEELFGKPSEIYFESSSVRDLSKHLRNVIRKGIIIKEYETVIRRKDGKVIRVLLNASPLRKGKKISGAVVIAEDNTEKLTQSIIRKLRIDTLEMAARGDDLKKILRFILKGFNKLYPEFQAVFFFYNSNTGQFRYNLTAGAPKNLDQFLQNMADKTSVLPHQKSSKLQKPVKSTNLQISRLPDEYKKIMSSMNAQSSLCLPIMDSQNLLTGIFEIFIPYTKIPKSVDMQNIKEFSQLIGLVTERKKIEYELKIKNKSLSSLYELSSAVMKEIEPDNLFDKIFQVLSGIEEIEAIRKIKIFLPKGENLVLFYNSDKKNKDHDFCTMLKPGECLCGKTFETGEVLYSTNSVNDPCHKRMGPNSVAHSHIVIPLIGKEKICGVLCMYTQRQNIRLNDNKKFFFLSVGRQIGLALENASLYEELKKMSLNDPLTGLANRHKMNIFVQKLAPQIKRKKMPVSLAFLDIDHFKEFNDTNGHAMGDQLLVTVAKVIQETIREEDLAVRYGGEEFLLVFSDTNIADSRKIVERIREKVFKLTGVSISAGLSLFQHQMEFQAVLEIADKALYKAKRTGRNKIVVADIANIKNSVE